MDLLGQIHGLLVVFFVVVGGAQSDESEVTKIPLYAAP
jgi:hypothetical protein